MNEEDFKRILEESLKPIREDIKELKETQAKHTDLLENSVLPSITYTENTIRVYSDMYKYVQNEQ